MSASYPSPAGRLPNAHRSQRASSSSVLSDSPWVHFGIGAAVVLAFGLSAVPEILREGRRAPSRMDTVLLAAEKEGLFLAFAVQDQAGRDMTVAGVADIRVFSTGLEPLPEAPNIAALARYRVDVAKDQFAEMGFRSGDRLLCRLDGIPYGSSRGLQRAVRTYQFIRVEVILRPHGGKAVLGRSEPVPMGDAAGLFPPGM